jgi:hypothetical protein
VIRICCVVLDDLKMKPGPQFLVSHTIDYSHGSEHAVQTLPAVRLGSRCASYRKCSIGDLGSSAKELRQLPLIERNSLTAT